MVSYEKLTKAGINIDTLQNRLMGNSSLIKVFVNKFVADTNFKSLVAAFSEKNMEKAEHASHTLKGMCGNMSLDELYALFTTQVNLIRAKECDEAEAMMGEISEAYTNAVTLMKEWAAEN